MTTRQTRKVENLQAEIRKIEDKLDKLLTLRKVLYAQIEKEMNRTYEGYSPSQEERKEQSERDKKKFVADMAANRSTIKRLEF